LLILYALILPNKKGLIYWLIICAFLSSESKFYPVNFKNKKFAFGLVSFFTDGLIFFYFILFYFFLKV
jgi:hypothetical protein